MSRRNIRRSLAYVGSTHCISEPAALPRSQEVDLLPRGSDGEGQLDVIGRPETRRTVGLVDGNGQDGLERIDERRRTLRRAVSGRPTARTRRDGMVPSATEYGTLQPGRRSLKRLKRGNVHM